jgi:hypothetical protein
MSLLYGIEQDLELNQTIRNRVKDCIKLNDPLDKILHVIMVLSNPCSFNRRYQLAREFILRMENEDHVQLYIVELCYSRQPFLLTKENHPRHLQLRTETPIWHKENMINIGTRLLPPQWKAMAWIDADIEFESSTWAIDTLKVLNGYADMVQIFSHAVDMANDESTMTVFNSAGYQYEKQLPYRTGTNFWHPGYAWACTRKAYEMMGGLYENAILGSGDQIMMLALMGKVKQGLHTNNHEDYKKDTALFEERTKHLRFSYVPGVIRHYFHGTKANRRYRERWQILVEHHYNPNEHLKKQENGLLIPTDTGPPKLLEDIYQYFKDRNEDD